MSTEFSNHPRATFGRHPEIPLRVIKTGLIEYGEMLSRQREVFHAMTERKRGGLDTGEETVFVVEHHPVITLGRHADKHNLLFSRDFLSSRGISVHEIERGGDITYHGPGQLVVYPLIDLEAHHIGVKDYVNILEEAVIRTMADFSIRGERVEGASGVWIGKGTAEERKICALGVKCSRYVTMHGLALNVCTDMSGFSLINPCGFIDKGVTSMRLEFARPHFPAADNPATTLPDQDLFATVSDTLTRHLLSLL